MRARMACGVPPTGSAPMDCNCLRTSGSARSLSILALNWSTIACGVPRGRHTPNHEAISKLLQPGLGKRRHVGQHAGAAGRGHRQRLELAGLDVG